MKNMTEEKSNNKNSNTGNVNSVSGSNLTESSGNGSNSTTTSSLIMRQNLANSKNVNSPTKSIGGETSSNENNITANSANISEGNLTPGSIDNIQDGKSEKCKNKNSINIMNSNILKNIKEENDENTHGPMKSDDVMTLINVKKEDINISPNLSPVSFNAISSSCKSNEIKQSPTAELTGNNGNEKNLALGTSLNNISGMVDKRVGGVRNSNSPQNESCNSATNSNINSQNAANHIFSGMGSNGNNGGSINNCTDYMQQQNHIFVFSTQLANKGAESVINGLFPTIIAYHCTQPATKTFLEDFFIKNPLKMAKFRNQNTNNLGPNGQPWIPIGNSSASLTKTEQQKGMNNKTSQLNSNGCNNSNLTSNIGSIKPTLHTGVLTGFSESVDDLHEDQELLCWDQTSNMRNHLENTPLNDLKILDDEDNIVDAKNKTNSISSNADNDGSIPSLQGVKVPDENLTPQQRQHREEQLAKLKKMNQFLFPENGSDFNINNKMVSSEVISGGVNNLMMNIPINSQQLRNVPANINTNKQQHKICNSDNTTGIRDENIGASELLAPNNTVQLPNSGNGNFGSSTITNAMNLQSNIHIGNNATRNNNCHLPVCQPNININGPNSNNSMLPDIINSRAINLNQNCNASGNIDGNAIVNKSVLSGPGGINSQDLNQSGIAGHSMEWSKLQNQIFDDRLRGNNQPTGNEVTNAISRSNSISGANANSRPNATCSSIIQGTRSIQGPPPPYHPIRSASVPIATQSPNPTSPNNATSNLSLPSPHTSNTGNNALINSLSSTSPNIDSQNIPSTPTTGIATDSQTIGSNTQSKNQNYQLQPHSQEGSPTNGNVSGVRNNRNANISQFNSNPSTPLSHISPKDMEAYNNNGVPIGADMKNTRPSPQRAKTPSNSSSNIGDVTSNLEGHFTNASPGLNFSQHTVGGNGPYKSPGSIERQHSAPAMSAAQFCRRADNVPLNPNTNRGPQNKVNHQFDPISSLAQMSQQLTSCVPPSSNMGIINTDQMNIPGNGNQNLEGIINSLDSGNMDHCNASNLMPSSMQPLINNSGGNSGPFPGISHNNLHSHGPMGQRILNPKLIGGPMSFNSNNSNMSLRDVPGNFPGNYPQRMMGGIGRIPIGNFNVSPNIQVKASTPNTIQYMPVRPQNHNNNMRVPPSVEFLQRYANPQMTAAGTSNNCGINIMENPNMGAMNSNIIASNLGETNKIVNSNSSIGVAGGNLGIGGGNFFPNQMVDQDELGNSSDFGLSMGTMHSQMIRPNMRNMRQSNIKSNAPQDLLDLPDNSNIFGGSTNAQLFGGVQMKQNIKNVNVGPPNICQNMNTANPGVNASQMTNQGLIQNEHNPVLQSPLLLGQNTNSIMHMNNNGNNNSANLQCGISVSNIGPNTGNANYKNFVGAVPNDLKYAQQYHSFQQQLYATSTRGGGTSNLNAGSSPSSFFVNK